MTRRRSRIDSRWPKWLTHNVLVLGVVSLLTDLAAEMAIPLLPVFIPLLGGGAMALGLIEGLADFISSLLKLYAGRLSDRLRARRPFVLGGYLLSSLARPLLALAAAPWHVLAVRVADRTGKGLRTAPRDALLTASVAPKNRGAAFGFHQSMDDFGAVLGGLTAVALLAATQNNLRLIFWLTAIPGALAVAAIAFGVNEARVPRPAASKSLGLPRPTREMLGYLVALGIFTLGASSDLFLLWKAGAERAPLYSLPLMWVGLHVVKSASTLAGGFLSDRIGDRACIALGWLFYALVYAGFAFVQMGTAFIVLFLFYGIFHGLTAGAEKSLVARLAPKGDRGSAFGWYHLIVGVTTLPANLIFGWLYDHAGPEAAFLTSAGFAAAGLALFLILADPRARARAGK